MTDNCWSAQQSAFVLFGWLYKLELNRKHERLMMRTMMVRLSTYFDGQLLDANVRPSAGWTWKGAGGKRCGFFSSSSSLLLFSTAGTPTCYFADCWTAKKKKMKLKRSRIEIKRDWRIASNLSKSPRYIQERRKKELLLRGEKNAGPLQL